VVSWLDWRDRPVCPACRRLPCACEDRERARVRREAERARVAEEGRWRAWRAWMESTARLVPRSEVPAWSERLDGPGPTAEDAPGRAISKPPWRCPGCGHEAPMLPAWCPRCGAVG
jgi:hypothetical protein